MNVNTHVFKLEKHSGEIVDIYLEKNDDIISVVCNDIPIMDIDPDGCIYKIYFVDGCGLELEHKDKGTVKVIGS